MFLPSQTIAVGFALIIFGLLQELRRRNELLHEVASDNMALRFHILNTQEIEK